MEIYSREQKNFKMTAASNKPVIYKSLYHFTPMSKFGWTEVCIGDSIILYDEIETALFDGKNIDNEKIHSFGIRGSKSLHSMQINDYIKNFTIVENGKYARLNKGTALLVINKIVESHLERVWFILQDM